MYSSSMPSIDQHKSSSMTKMNGNVSGFQFIYDID